MIKLGYFNIEVREVIDKLHDLGYFGDINPNVPNNYMVTCPFHKGGREIKPSFGIHKENGKCHCFTCNWKGSIFDLVKELTHTDGKEWVEKNVGLNITTTRREMYIPKRTSPQLIKRDWVSDFTRDNTKALQYLESRGIYNIDHIFPIGYWSAYNAISFVIRDTNGEIGWIKSRKLDRKQFYNNAGSKKSEFVYGLYECICAGAKQVWLCESETDCLTVWSRGEYAVATSGATLSQSQVELLQKYGIRTVIDGMDRDVAGREGWKTFKEMTNLSTIETRWNNPHKDINATSEKEFRDIEKIMVDI